MMNSIRSSLVTSRRSTTSINTAMKTRSMKCSRGYWSM